MKRIKLLIIVFVCLFVFNVKADMGPPMIVNHDVKVINKSGAVCYERLSGKYTKSSKIIPYGTALSISEDIFDTYYISVFSRDNDEYNCIVKYSDISAVNQSFNLNNESVTKITTRKAVVLAKGGLNMRKGPAVTYGKITTVPQYAVVTITHNAGDYWYYTEYNGHKGWITGMNGYFGYERKEILINNEPVKIYSTADQKSVLGTIPANTEITDYLDLVTRSRYDASQYYVVYNGIKGYIGAMYYKIDGTGKIKVTSDYSEYDNIVLKANEELEYSMLGDSSDNCFYFPSKKNEICVDNGYFKYITEAKLLTKTKGYIGEGLFGEAKTKKDDEPMAIEENEEQEEIPVIPEEEKTMSIKDIIIIGLLAGIFLALTALVIIKLVNSKKKTVSKPKEEPIKREEINVPDKEIAKAREELIKEMNRGKHEESTPVKKEDNKEE